MAFDHPLRRNIDEELHSRPALDIPTPATVHHCVLLTDQDSALHSLIDRVCDAVQIDPAETGERHIVRTICQHLLKWERHGEFETITLVSPGPVPAGQSDLWTGSIEPVLAELMPGRRISASRITINKSQKSDATRELAQAPETVIGVRISGGDAHVWTDYAIGKQGFTDLRLDVGMMSPKRCGRLVQRILEIETYRFMALLGFPVARTAQQNLQSMNQKLDAIVADLDLSQATTNTQTLLDRIQMLAHEANILFGETAFRFAATKAYDTIVQSRLSELREERIPGYSRIGTFLGRRMAPAISHCAAIERQRDTLDRRLGEVSQLLRTKVETGLARQNQLLLEQIQTSTRSQLRLQHAVEGFSVVAISYYLVSILAVFLKGGEKAGLLRGWELYEAAIAPLAIIVVFLLTRRASHSNAKGQAK